MPLWKTLTIVIVGASLAATDAMAVSSSASAMSVTLSVPGLGVQTLKNVFFVQDVAQKTSQFGAGKLNYHFRRSFFDGKVLWTARGLIADIAAVKVAANGTVTATGSAKIHSLAAGISHDNGAERGPVVVAQDIFSSTSIRKTRSATGAPDITVKLSNLSVAGPFSGLNISQLTVAPTKNQVLATGLNGTITVIGNRQTDIVIGGKVVGVTVDALDIHLDKFVYNGALISGDITFGTSAAKSVM